MTRKPTTRQQLAAMEKAGVRYHSFGTLRDGRAKRADYYLTDGITDEQKTALAAALPGWVTFGSSRPSFAPEIRRSAIVFPCHQ